MEWLTEKVRYVAVKADLENITKTSLVCLTDVVLDMFQGIIEELIHISRSNRGLATLVNQRKIEEGVE